LFLPFSSRAFYFVGRFDRFLNLEKKKISRHAVKRDGSL